MQYAYHPPACMMRSPVSWPYMQPADSQALETSPSSIRLTLHLHVWVYGAHAGWSPDASLGSHPTAQRRPHTVSSRVIINPVVHGTPVPPTLSSRHESDRFVQCVGVASWRVGVRQWILSPRVGPAPSGPVRPRANQNSSSVDRWCLILWDLLFRHFMRSMRPYSVPLKYRLK